MIVIVAGPELSPSALRAASIGRWAFADDARLNVEHWQAAAADKSGYRSADPVESVPAPSGCAPSICAGAVGRSERAAELIATIPDDLSIHDFLKRGPKS